MTEKTLGANYTIAARNDKAARDIDALDVDAPDTVTALDTITAPDTVAAPDTCVAFDTSNYTTSEALYSGGRIIKNERIMLPVADGGRGLRQSDAVFAHTINLPELTPRVGRFVPSAVGCSVSPRDEAGSYMPCFLVGIAAASAVANAFGVPLYRFSHQAGHIMAALYGCGRIPLWYGEFLAFHVSGGTTELLHVAGGVITRLGGTRDISAGKAIDRIGVTLGLRFPCGKELEKSAAEVDKPLPVGKICVDGFDCNLSGLENKAAGLVSDGTPAPRIAAYTLDFIAATIVKMTENALQKYPNLPVLYAGGVMSNKRIRAALVPYFDAYFAPPELSCDNAAGIAVLTAIKNTDSF